MSLVKNEEHPVVFLRLVWVDVGGVRRCRAIPLFSHASRRAAPEGRAIPIVDLSRARKFLYHTSRMALVCFFLPCYGDEGLVLGAWERGDVVLSPAPGPAVKLPGSCDWLAVSTIHLDGPARTPYPWCPRALLHGACERLRRVFGVCLAVGFETEFVLLDAVTKEGLESSVYCQTSGFDVAAEVLREMTSALQACGQTVLHVHGESAPGQFEIVTSHSDDVVGQADAFVVRQEVIQRVARKHGLLASFLPKIWAAQGGTASHVHFSIKSLDKARGKMDGNAPVHGELGDMLAHFMGGILNNVDSLLLHTIGSPNSWRRAQPGCWAGAYACWGTQNKEALLRVIDSGANHVEFKGFDGTANPYLGLGALVCAGMAGLATAAGSSLPPPIRQDPQHTGTSRRLPTASYEQLVKACLGNHIEEKMVRADAEGNLEHQWRESMRAHCGDDTETEFMAFFEDFARLKMAEVERFKGMSFEDEVDLLLERY
mmetsp:Transcript_11903/g.33536  ORF Transcript_11903/g.33536 Transcript_11903/m.33536 type:complete len:485 (-) Transcript_11903:494-1948(-)